MSDSMKGKKRQNGGKEGRERPQQIALAGRRDSGGVCGVRGRAREPLQDGFHHQYFRAAQGRLNKGLTTIRLGTEKIRPGDGLGGRLI